MNGSRPTLPEGRPPWWLMGELYTVAGILGFLAFCFAAERLSTHGVRLAFWAVTLPAEAALILAYVLLKLRKGTDR